jgi:hypothetical protein
MEAAVLGLQRSIDALITERAPAYSASGPQTHCVNRRLLLVDLSSVEAIWRVLLFLVCGAVFLYTGYRMQPRRNA